MRKILFIFSALIITLIIHTQQRLDPQPAPDAFEKFKAGMAGYTFVNFDLDWTPEVMDKCDICYLCIKDFHLPLSPHYSSQ